MWLRHGLACAFSSILLLGSSSATEHLPRIPQGGLKIKTTHEVQCSRSTQAGDKISVHYNGTLQKNGNKFDSSYDRNMPLTFTLGIGQVIEGWDKGLLDMCKGEERRLTIPPHLAYGNRAMGSIPAGSTLVFETKLMDILGVEDEEEQPSNSKPEKPSKEKPSKPASEEQSTQTQTPIKPDPGSEEPDPDEGECRLLGPFALVVQAGLGVLALSSLVWKRYRERPRRPLKIWFFDASKQVVGSALLHVLNLVMSMLSSADFNFAHKAKELNAQMVASDGRRINPCSFYLINIAIDTTLGIPILIFFLRLLHYGFRLTPLARPVESIKSGHYGDPPRATWWLKQALIYFIGLVMMKLCVFFIYELLPWIAWVGDWALRWTEGNEAIQITFVMFVFPLIMNALQYYIIDSFIKEPGQANRMQAGGDADSGSGASAASYHSVSAEVDDDSDRDSMDSNGERRKSVEVATTEVSTQDQQQRPLMDADDRDRNDDGDERKTRPNI